VPVLSLAQGSTMSRQMFGFPRRDHDDTADPLALVLLLRARKAQNRRDRLHLSNNALGAPSFSPYRSALPRRHVPHPAPKRQMRSA
jgi:hypothetical protein